MKLSDVSAMIAQENDPMRLRALRSIYYENYMAGYSKIGEGAFERRLEELLDEYEVEEDREEELNVVQETFRELIVLSW